MQCFNHPDVSAVGMCKHCCKGLCASCATDLGYGLACREKHETEVSSAQAMMQKASRIQAANRSNKYLSPIFFIVLGVLFCGWGYFRDGSITSFACIMGVPFVVYGIFLLNVVRRAYVQPKA